MSRARHPAPAAILPVGRSSAVGSARPPWPGVIRPMPPVGVADRSRPPRPSLLPWSLALVAALVAAPAAADYRQSYLDGRRALERGEVEQAIALLGAAARERPLEQARARLVGAIPEPYLPHHFLGLAYFRARRCPEAVAAWELSERQGAVQSVPAARAIARRHRAECASLEAAERAVEDAGEAAAALAAAAGDREAGRGPPGFDRRRRAALEGLESARALLGGGRREWDFAPIAEAVERAQAAAGELRALRAEVSRRPPPSRRDPEGTGPETEGDPAPGAAIDPGAAVDPPADRPDGAEPPPAAVSPTPPDPPPVVLSGGAAAETAGAPLADDLLAAIQAYFDGDYRGALALLASSGPAPGGASRHALFLLGGERDRALLRAAEADVAECRRAAPGFAPQRDHFSPRFVAFFAGLP